MTDTVRKNRRGGSALELAFFLPWYIFLFIGAFDWGFYAHALISAENAVRVAVLYTSSAGAGIEMEDPGRFDPRPANQLVQHVSSL